MRTGRSRRATRGGGAKRKGSVRGAVVVVVVVLAGWNIVHHVVVRLGSGKIKRRSSAPGR